MRFLCLFYYPEYIGTIFVPYFCESSYQKNLCAFFSEIHRRKNLAPCFRQSLRKNGKARPPGRAYTAMYCSTVCFIICVLSGLFDVSNVMISFLPGKMPAL